MFGKRRSLSYIFFIPILFLGLNNNILSQNYSKVDSLKRELQKQTNDSVKIKILNELAWNIKNNDFDSSMNYSLQAKELSEKYNNKQQLAEALKNIGNIYDLKGNFVISESYHRKALAIFWEIKDTIGMANCYNNIGNVAKRNTNYVKSIEFLFKALELYEVKKDSSKIPISYVNIGLVFNRLKDYQKALSYLLKAADIIEKQDNPQTKSSCFLNIGMVYSNLNNYEKSVEYYNKSLDLKRKQNDRKNISNIYISFGDLYCMKGNYDSAIFYLNKALEIKEEFSDNNGKALVYSSFVQLYLKQNNLSNAIDFNKKCFEIAQQYNFKLILLDCYKNFEKINQKKGNYKLAYDYLQKHIILNDSITGNDVQTKILEYEKQIEIEKNEAEIKLLTIENEFKTRQIEKNRQIIWLTILICLLFVVVASISLIAYKIIRNKNNKLNQQNEEIESQRDYIASQRDIIKEELTNTLVKTEILQRENIQYKLEALKNQLNPHFLFNTFSTLISLIPENQELAELYARNLSNVYRYILTMHDNELATIEEELNFINAYLFMVKIRFDNKVSLDINIEEKVKVFYIPSFSLQLLVENAIKHNIISSKRPLKILINNIENKLCVKNNLQKKASAENSTGIGLNNIISRYKFLSHEIVEIICTDSEFVVKLPIIFENDKSKDKLQNIENECINS
jgi:sensor histidine kinase YesM